MFNTHLIPHESDDTRQLRLTVIKLTQEFDAIENEINVFNNDIDDFDREYQNRLGDLEEAVKALRAELGMAEEKESEDGEEPPAPTNLAEPEYQLLKTAFRKAAKICHPDYLPSELRERGTQIFDSLNKAYHLQDLVTVEHILWLLQSGQAFSETPVMISDLSLLEKRHELLGHLITQRKDQLNQMRIKEEFDVSNRDNWNSILYDYQTRLEDEIADLRDQAQ